ncbi:condensation protein [Streptomyces platensis]|uniref:condensation protein n=1 Tax=Streptomyces platensis TaxID=58346 RepID=UPI003870D810|nr:condensation protein [Streptomyces platensis]
MTALQPARHEPPDGHGTSRDSRGTPADGLVAPSVGPRTPPDGRGGLSPAPSPSPPSGEGAGGGFGGGGEQSRGDAIARLPFPVVDEISRHCLDGGEPETVHIEVHLPGRVDPVRLRTAFHRALARHPRILMRQAPVRWWHRRYHWQLTATPDVDPVAFPPPGPGALARARQRALDHCPPLDASPPVRLEVIEEAEGGTVLLLTLHHTALDGPACLRVLATTAELYGGADNSPTPAPVRAPGPRPEPPPADHPPAPGPRLARPARIAPDTGPAPTRAPGPTPAPGSALQPSKPGRPNRPDRPSQSTHPANANANSNRPGNGMLLTDLPIPTRPPRTPTQPAPYTVNDQLLVATWLMVARWNQLHAPAHPHGAAAPPADPAPAPAPIVVTMPVDDRPRDAGMPIGNGTRLVSVGFGPEERRDAGPLTADPPDPDAVARLLRRTAARTRALKAAAPGSQLGLYATLLTAPVLPVGLRGAVTRTLRRAAAPWTSTTLLSNIGRIAYPLDFGDAGRPTAVWFSAPARMPRGLTVTTVSVAGRIQLALRWSPALLDDAAGARLGDLFRSSLAATAWTPPPAGGAAR